MERVKIFFDGGTFCNRICFYDNKSGKVKMKSIPEDKTNNELEYLALISAIKYAKYEYKDEKVIEFIGDSRLIIGQVWSGWKVNHDHLLTLKEEVQRQRQECNFTCIGTWVRRDVNKAGIYLENLKRGKDTI